MTTQNKTQSALGLPARRARSGLRARAQAEIWNAAQRFVLVFVAAALLLLAADALLLRLHPGSYQVPVGNYRDEFFLKETNFQEAAEGRTYRWTTARSVLELGGLGIAPYPLLRLTLGGRPEPADLHLTLNEQPWTTFPATTERRVYTLLLPPDLPTEVAIGLQSATFTPPNDSRQLGVKVENFALAWPGANLPLPTPLHYGSQLGLVLAAQLAALRLGWRWPAQALLAGGLALGLALLLSTSLLLAYVWLPRLAVAGMALAALTWLMLPQAERRLGWAGPPREIRLLWGLTLLACAVRLVAVLYPTFDGQDLGRNVGRLVMSVTGQMIIIGPSSEFADGLTIYPTGPYIGVLPALTFTNDLYGVMEGAVTLLEGTTAFLVALLVRQFGGGRDAARFGALLYAGNIASFSGLVYCFSAQLWGQWFTAPLALVLLAASPRPNLRAWGFALVLLLIGVYSHIGVAILGVTWFGLLLLFQLRHARAAWWAAGLALASGLLALALLYVDIAAITLSHAATSATTGGEGGLLRGWTPLLIKGLRLAYSDVGVALLPLGLLLLAGGRRMRGRWWVLGATLLTVLLYLAVDLLLAMQVRYFYFALPFVLAVVAVLLGRTAARGRLARLAAWALVLALFASGVAQWWLTTFGSGGISMTPLTH